jgi:hypothetical protein
MMPVDFVEAFCPGYEQLVQPIAALRSEHPTIWSWPAPAGVVAPGESPESKEHRFRAADSLVYFRLTRERFARFAASQSLAAVYPEPVEHCDVCAWWAQCGRAAPGR